MRQALGLTLSVTPRNSYLAGDANRRCERAFLSSPQKRRLALNRHRRPTPTSSSTSTRSLLLVSARGNRASAPRRAAAAAAAAGGGGGGGKAQTATSEGLGLDHPAFSPVVSLPLLPGGGGFGASSSRSSLDDRNGDGGGEAAAPPFTTLVVRPLHPSDVPEITEALLAAFESDSDPPERPQLERRLEREAGRYALVDPGPWLLHSVSLPPPRAPPRAAAVPAPAAAAAAAAGEEETEHGERGIGKGAEESPLPWAGLVVGLPGSLRRRRAAELEALAEERAAAAWEEALEDAWGRWLWLVAEARSDGEGVGGGSEGGEGRAGERRRIVGAAALLFHDRSRSLRALERLASSEFGAAEENRRRWPRPDAASMDYCLWLRERFPAAGWPPPPPRSGGGGASSASSPFSSSSVSSASSSCSSALDAGAPGGSDSSSSSPSSLSPPSSSSEEGVFGPCASLWWVGTLPQARGRGVGAALLDASAAVAAAAGFPRLFAQVEEWSSGAGGGGGGAAGRAALQSNRGRRSGGLSGAPWLGSGGEEAARSPSSSRSSSSRSSSSRSSSPPPAPTSPVERMYRSAGFVEVPEPPREGGGERGGGMAGLGRRRDDGGAVDRSAVLLQKEIW